MGLRLEPRRSLDTNPEVPAGGGSPEDVRRPKLSWPPMGAASLGVGSTSCAPLDPAQRQARAQVILRKVEVPHPHPEPQVLAERHQRHAAVFADLQVRYTPALILPEGGMPAIVELAMRKQLKQALGSVPLTSGKAVAHAESLGLREVADVEILPVGQDVGSGVFARSPIRRGTFLGEYTGELRFLPADVMWPFLTANGYSFEYGAQISLKKGIAVIDGLEAGNFTRFLNHSYHPNAVSHQLLLEDGMHTYFVARRDIAAGEQLSINYTRGYWKGRGKPAPL